MVGARSVPIDGSIFCWRSPCQGLSRLPSPRLGSEKQLFPSCRQRARSPIKSPLARGTELGAGHCERRTSYAKMLVCDAVGLAACPSRWVIWKRPDRAAKFGQAWGRERGGQDG